MAQPNIAGNHTRPHPLDVVEKVMAGRDWPFSRGNDDELATEFRGNWCDLHIQFAWTEKISAIHVACTFDFRVPPAKRQRVHDLLALINDRLWLGHFCLWQAEGVPMFRHTMLLSGGAVLPQQVRDVLDVVVVECDRFYPSFQFVVWGGKEAGEALEASILEPVGLA